MKKVLKWGVGIVVAGLLLIVLFGPDAAPVPPPPPDPEVKRKIDNAGLTCVFPGEFKKHPSNPLKSNSRENCYPSIETEYNGDCSNLHPLGTMGDPMVLRDQGKYKLWFTANAADGDKEILGTAYAESSDGLVWSNPKNAEKFVNLVLEPTPGAWDSLGIESVSVVKKAGKFYLYYTGIGERGEDVGDIGLATSFDGRSWVKHPTPVLSPELDWEKVSVGGRDLSSNAEPSVLYDSALGLFKMWYSAGGVLNGEFGIRIGYATSRDGINWEKHTEPVIVPGPKGAWDDLEVSQVSVVKDPSGKGYHAFYIKEAGSTTHKRIGHAVSLDGINWIKNPDNPVLTETPGSWDKGMAQGPSVLLKDGKFFMWYMGGPTGDFFDVKLGLATVDCSN